jgi:hypothetical protein
MTTTEEQERNRSAPPESAGARTSVVVMLKELQARAEKAERERDEAREKAREAVEIVDERLWTASGTAFDVVARTSHRLDDVRSAVRSWFPENGGAT